TQPSQNLYPFPRRRPPATWLRFRGRRVWITPSPHPANPLEATADFRAKGGQPVLRFILPLGLAVLAAILAFAIVGSAFAREGVRPDQPVSINSMRSIVDHYRTLTWTYQRAAHRRKTPTSFTDRRSDDRSYLQWSIDVWTRRA